MLRGDVDADAAMVVVGDGGGFHLLPSGTPEYDPNRLLQGARLGQLISSFRENFDLVIIDSPPILPVPDSLILGRWSDGAVLAVRHDTSRFQLIKQARERLASVGIPLLGAVVNGVSDSNTISYGGHGYYDGGRDPAASVDPVADAV
jgi:Mrp family chromosome partitioning ATPase